MLTAATEDDVVIEDIESDARGYLQNFASKEQLLASGPGRCRD